MRYLFFALLMFSSIAAQAKPYHDYEKRKHTSEKEFIQHKKKKNYHKSNHHQYSSKDHHGKYSWKKH